ncbi:alpha/beta hydrolase [Psychromonas sp. RZ22]|uniref:alpha/beta hydrolase n=1 Tax=Psychromonas algarum TaxID=2555643 RepID=UPI0010686BFE|nr:alpha/beta fold hydrolase [Psychromonas sp. RZ22]TEW55254.1 alpha/beta hydrolase [Psychromonas sp. RZ22]
MLSFFRQSSLVVLFLLLLFAFFNTGCSQRELEPSYQHAESLPRFNQPTFSEYQQQTKAWLVKYRYFMTENHEQELSLVLPKEYQPVKANGKAVLLVHGLGDTPYTFTDVASHLAEQGYLVRTILLPGHASKVGDLILPSLADWQGVIDHHIDLLKQQSKHIWLGGYSTGANLVMSKALQDDQIEGVLLFSPAFQPRSSAARWAGLARHFVTWADRDPEDNPLRYSSLPMNAANVYYQTVKNVQEDLKGKTYNKPVFMMMGEGDQVIDTDYALAVFNTRMKHPNNHLVWLGEVLPKVNNVSMFSMDLPEKRISNSSHMGILFSPENSHYGEKGSQLICDNGQPSASKQACEAGEEVWFSAWGFEKDARIHARLTYNPYFEETMLLMDQVMGKD